MKNDYYVYLHHLEDGTVFYVGKGRGDRAYSKQNRSKKWLSVINNTNYSISFYKKDITEKEALSIELELIRTTPNLVNIKKTNHITNLNIELLNKYVEYSESSPSGLIWKIDRHWGSKKDVICCRKSDIVGNIAKRKNGTSHGWKCEINGISLFIHRVIYTICIGKIPDGMVINHIDNNPLNNKLSNLELCTIAENNRRAKSHDSSIVRKTSSGVTGVRLQEHSSGYSIYRAYYNELSTGKTIVKSFSIIKHGKEEAFRLACEWRKARILELNMLGAGYVIK